ncbi:MAG: hypothetical protein K2X93_00360 [Candidatus Obscuribacterales bacterium]|nr:hypothetical protein [Candidatus Obscuribacterales bacterium]
MRNLQLPNQETRAGGLLLRHQHNQSVSNYKFRILGIEPPTCSDKFSRSTNDRLAQATLRRSSRLRLRGMFQNLWLTRLKNAMSMLRQSWSAISRKDPRLVFETKEIAISQN